jgi:hypothetical protein
VRWQKWTRLVLVLIALAVVASVVLTLRRRRAISPPSPTVVRTDPKAIVESTTGRAGR